ncbi:hypothetical protein [Bremerella sp.]|uniref:hypothetical protein n=1 Tax=Bremerella sp. TaxID=2795602 RepID=UPI00391D0D79
MALFTLEETEVLAEEARQAQRQQEELLSRRRGTKRTGHGRRPLCSPSTAGSDSPRTFARTKGVSLLRRRAARDRPRVERAVGIHPRLVQGPRAPAGKIRLPIVSGTCGDCRGSQQAD